MTAGNIANVLDILRHGPARSPSLAEIGHADATLVLGEDVCNTAPMIALAIRQAALREGNRHRRELHIPAWHDAAVREAIQQERGPLFIATSAATRLDEIGHATSIGRAR